MLTNKNLDEYSCKAPKLKECQGFCCSLCLGSPECDWACEDNPATCGQSIKAKC